MIAIILGILLILYPLSGYIKGSRLETEMYEFFFIGIGKRILWVIDADKLPWFLSVVPLPYPFKWIYPKLKWTEWIHGKGKMNQTIITPDGKKEDKFKEKLQFDTVEDGFLGTRDEYVPSLRKLEPVAYLIEVKTKDGYKLYMLLTIILRVFGPLKAIRMPSFKMYGETEAVSFIQPWAFKEDIVSIHETNINKIKDIKIGISDDGEDLETHLNKKFKPKGFEIAKMGLRMIDTKESKAFFDLRQKESQLEQQKNNAKKFGEVRKEERQVEFEDANQENTILGNKLKTTRNGMKGIIKDIYKGKAKVAAARKNVLVEVNHEVDEVGEKYMQLAEKALVPSVSNTTSANKFKKEEMESKSITPKDDKKEEVEDDK